MSRRPTIQDVAKWAGVSNVTVSRVVNEQARVRSATRERVRLAMRDLGYLPNAAARSMRTNLSRSIGCLVPDLVNLANAAIAQHAERHLAAAGYSLLLASSDYDPAAEVRAIEALRARGVDGLLLYVSDETDPGLVEALDHLDVPAVVLDRELPAAADTLFSEHTSAMHEVVRYLAGLGHRRLALLTPALRIRPVTERQRAFGRAIEAAGLDPSAQRIVAVPPYDQQRAHAAQALLGTARRPTAVLADGGRQVRGVLRAARGQGLMIPSDLSLVGLDASDIDTVTTPELTVITRDYGEIGRTAARLLLDRLADPAAPPRRLVLDSQVVLRGSCAAPAEAAPSGAGMDD